MERNGIPMSKSMKNLILSGIIKFRHAEETVDYPYNCTINTSIFNTPCGIYKPENVLLCR